MMMRHRMGLRSRGTVVLAALTVLAAVPAARAQTPPSQADAGVNGKVTGAGSGSNYGAPGNQAMDPSKGVAGTGMGKMPMKGNSMGTGNSVQGPPGQGIDGMGTVSNSTDTAK